MGLARYWDVQTLTSNVFRLVVWLFLRVIPSPRLTRVIPILYALYLGSWMFAIFGHPKEPPTLKSSKQEIGQADVKDVKDLPQNGDTTPVVSSPKPQPHGTLSTLALSLPTSSLGLRIVVFLINTLLLTCTIDFVTRPTRDPASSLIFTRIGAVDPDGAKVVVRWPEAEQGAVRIVWRQSSAEAATLDVAWKNGPVVYLRNESDWVGVARIKGLWPSTDYEYRLAYKNSTHLPYPRDAIPFRTFPDPRLTTGNHFKFLSSSCIMPNFPYLPFAGSRIKGFDLLNDYVWPSDSAASKLSSNPAVEAVLPSTDAKSSHDDKLLSNAAESEVSELPSSSNTVVSTEKSESTSVPLVTTLPLAPVSSESSSALAQFMLLLGDFVYAEVPWYGGDNVETYRRLYRRAYASPSFRKVYERLPILHIYDDHEIINNFVGQSNTSTQPFPNASSAYYTYNGQANYDPVTKGVHYYEFRYGDVAFFVLDTRLYRSGHIAQETEKKTMLGEQQLSALYEWLERVNTTTTFKFIVSSVPFTSLWMHDAQVDSWAAYLEERDELLTVLGTVHNVIILSGDRHEFAAIEFLGGKVVEFSTSPLSMFYVPIVRTLRSRSQRLAEKWVQKVEVDETGQEVIRNELELVAEEQVLKYLPLGNYKWSAFEIDTTNRQKPTLKVEVVINGRTEWQHTIIGQPVRLTTSSALGAQITQGLKGALSKIGFAPTRWF